MKITPAADRKTAPGNPDWFTGRVMMDPLPDPEGPARMRGALVTFEPGARTNWHTHPFGQTLLVTSGSGLAQVRGEPVRPLRTGDAVWFPPGEEHWHGAGPDTSMVHLALQEAGEDGTVAWLEPVSDAEYGSPPG